MKMFEERQTMTAYILIYENLGHIPDSYKFNLDFIFSLFRLIQIMWEHCGVVVRALDL